MIHDSLAAKFYDLLLEYGYITDVNKPTHIKIIVENNSIEIIMEFI